MLIPKDPDTYFAAINDLRANSAQIQQALAAEADRVRVDTFDFFDGMIGPQIELTESQHGLHESVLDIEEKWTNAPTVTASHLEYREAVGFFNRQEQNINAMAQQMQELTDRVARLPQ
jgi:hypothetical protein